MFDCVMIDRIMYISLKDNTRSIYEMRISSHAAPFTNLITKIYKIITFVYYYMCI